MAEKKDFMNKDRPLVMAIINRNEDSFFEASRNRSAEEAAEKALQAETDGADIIDIGGESTRPGAAYIDADEEIRRVLPVIRLIRQKSSVPISVDTRKVDVARAALDEGADIINDISALSDDPALAAVCAAAKVRVVLMHKKGVPTTMQDAPFYTDTVSEVAAYLRDAAERAIRAGIEKENIILDPGIGFGKRLLDNAALLRRLEALRAIGYPVLIGLSRKTFIGEITGRDVPDRLAGTLAATAFAVLAGAGIIRAHDVKETVDVIKVITAIAAA